MLVKFWNDGWTPNGNVTIPDDYEFLKAGNASLTRAVIKAMGDKTVFAEMYKKKGRAFSRQLGIYALSQII